MPKVFPDLICPGCKGRFYTTNIEYDEDKRPNPTMFSMKEPYRSWGWEQFPKDATAGTGCLECPQCGTPYLIQPDERLLIDWKECEYCRKKFANFKAVNAHMRMCDIAKAEREEYGEKIAAERV